MMTQHCSTLRCYIFNVSRRLAINHSYVNDQSAQLFCSSSKHGIQGTCFGRNAGIYKATLYSICKKRINDIIDSYGKRLHELIKTKGGKIEY